MSRTGLRMSFNEERHLMTTPNLYRFATKELAQDATVAYILEWAKPKYKKSCETLNGLGMCLLRALVRSPAGREGADLEIRSLKVGVQRDNIDVWAEINNEIFLIIEDKIGTDEHSDQIASYIKKVKSYKTENGNAWKTIVPVYFKTGNKSQENFEYLEKKGYGVFLRNDMSEVLDKYPNTSNTIIEDFRRHLQKLEDDANRKRESFVSRAEKLGVEDLFVDIEKMFKENWRSPNLRIYDGLYLDLQWSKTEKPLSARIDLKEKMIGIVFFPDAISLCVDEFKPLLKEIPFKTWPPNREAEAKNDLHAALKKDLAS